LKTLNQDGQWPNRKSNWTQVLERHHCTTLLGSLWKYR
jgi:hypothetical protein